MYDEDTLLGLLGTAQEKRFIDFYPANPSSIRYSYANSKRHWDIEEKASILNAIWLAH
jgi:hypothetical protein